MDIPPDLIGFNTKEVFDEKDLCHECDNYGTYEIFYSSPFCELRYIQYVCRNCGYYHWREVDAHSTNV